MDFLRSELGVPGLGFVFFNVDGGEHVLAHEAFVQQNRVLVVVAFPRHEADEHVLAERDLALRASRAVCNDLTGFTRSPAATIGRWLMQVPWLERANL